MILPSCSQADDGDVLIAGVHRLGEDEGASSSCQALDRCEGGCARHGRHPPPGESQGPRPPPGAQVRIAGIGPCGRRWMRP